MVWIQFSRTDGSQQATNSVRVEVLPDGRGQIEYDGDPNGMMVDITQTPHVVIAAPVPLVIDNPAPPLGD